MGLDCTKEIVVASCWARVQRGGVLGSMNLMEVVLGWAGWRN